MADTLAIITFAGQPVPEDGLTVFPPQGGELTIWPDGGYAFMPADGEIAAGQTPVTTYYNFVMEDVDGSTSVGTFALNPLDEFSGSAEDFRAWSLPELLQDAGDAFLLLTGEQQGQHVHAAGVGTHVSSLHAEFGGAESFDDDLTRLILDSQNS